ncbi:MAG: PAS domain S-box protein [Melioribacteraceae bacterium]|nr:PAS domain S-box protein [Melioribacteraceae bacterium]
MNVAYDLFLLMFNLSHLHSKEKIIELFIDGMGELFKPMEFQFAETESKERDFQFEIKSRSASFGFITIQNTETFSEESEVLIQNSIRMLAVDFERLQLDEILKKEKNIIEQIAEKTQNELQTKIKELNESRNASLNLIADLTEEIEKRKKYERELKDSEEKFRNLFEYSTVGKSLTQLDGTVEVNKAFCNIVGYSAEELKTKKWVDITHPDDIEKSNEVVKSLISGEIKTGRFEKRYIHKNGNIVWVDVSTYLQKDENGEPQFFITSTIDITERKKAEEALRQSEEMMRNSQSVAHICSYCNKSK